MNLKNILVLIIGTVIFVVIWFFSIVVALSLLCGSGIGLLVFKPIKELFNNLQRNIYLSEKENISSRKKELESELEKINLTLTWVFLLIPFNIGKSKRDAQKLAQLNH